MQIPVPNNKLVAFTLAGALLTAIVAGALAVPGGDISQGGEQADSGGTTASNASQQVGPDAPAPNQDFTPEVQDQSDYEEDEYEEEYEEHEGYEEYEEHDEEE